VVINVDCVRHKYTCKVDDVITYEGLIDPRFKSINEIRTKHFANTQEWTTYLDEIRVKEIISG